MQIGDSSKRFKTRLVAGTALIVALILGITYFYIPLTWGTVFNGQLSGDKTASFRVDLALDEDWNVETWTNTQGTKCNVTLVGYPIRSDGQIVNSTTLLYSWTEELESPGVWSGYEFGLKVPWSVYGSVWSFTLQAEGTGNVDIAITKFNPWDFTIMLLLDVALATTIIAFGIRYRYYTSRKKISTEFPKAKLNINH